MVLKAASKTRPKPSGLPRLLIKVLVYVLHVKTCPYTLLSAVPWANRGPLGQELLPDTCSEGALRDLHQPEGGQHTLQTATGRVPHRALHL